jgi:hypothetical protein
MFNFVSLKTNFTQKSDLKKNVIFTSILKPSYVQEEGLEIFKSFQLRGVLQAKAFKEKKTNLSISSVSEDIPLRIYTTSDKYALSFQRLLQSKPYDICLR